MKKQSHDTHRNERNARAINPQRQRLITILKFGRRWSSNPQKHLCFTWLSRILARSDKFDTTLDVACGNLNNYPFVKSANYIGTDMNRASLEFGRKVYPSARTELLFIEELDDSGLKGDLVLCTQTIGVNSHFNSENTMGNVLTLVKCTNKNGTIVFDTGPMSVQYDGEIRQLLGERFSAVSFRKFGSQDRGTNFFVSVFIASLMQMFPGLATRDNGTRRFYVAEGKHEDN